jgi:hypothetical protein
MKRKTIDTPTRIYSYGCLAPTKGAELLEEQLRLAHRYRNTLVEIERRRRDRVTEAICAVGDVGPLTAKAEELEQALAQTRSAIRAKRAAAKRAADTAEESARAGMLLAELRAAWTELKKAKQRVKNDETLRASLSEIEEQARADVQKARASSGVFWGTYLQVEAAVNRSRTGPTPPRFTPYDGTGRVAIQLQGDRWDKTKKRGLTVAALFACEDNRLRVRPVPADTYDRPRHQRRLASRTVAWIRAGTVEGKRDPLWIELPVILHRPLPDDALIKWAWVLRTRVGIRLEYSLQFVFEAESLRSPSAPTGNEAVAVDLGWRNKPDGGIRVAYWVDTAGQAGEVLVPIRTQLGLRKPEDLHAIRDKAFSEIRQHLLRWLESQSELPEELRQRTKRLAEWRSQTRLGALLCDWETARVEGDHWIFRAMQEWAQQERHLLAWEAHQRDRRLGHREEEYRRFAARLARTYATIVLKKFDLRRTRKMKVPEEGARSDGRKQRRTAYVAAPGELRVAIKDAAAKYGAAIVEIDSPDTTRACSSCGCVNEWKASSSIIHSCAHCGETWDQDHNACCNMLARVESARVE